MSYRFGAAIALSLFAATAQAWSATQGTRKDNARAALTTRSGTTIDHFVRRTDGVAVLDAVEYHGQYLQAATVDRQGSSTAIAVAGLPTVRLTETDGPQRLTVSTDAGILGRWFFVGTIPSRVDFGMGHSLNFTIHGTRVLEKLTGHSQDEETMEFEAGYGRGVNHPVILDLVAEQLAFGDDWTAHISIRPNETGSVYAVFRETGEVAAYVVRGGKVNVVYDSAGTPILYDIDLAEQFYPAGPEVAHMPRRILVSADGRAEWEAPQAPEGSIGATWIPAHPEHGSSEVRIRLRNTRPAAVNAPHTAGLVAKPDMYQICDTNTICTTWDGGSSCVTTNYYCDAGYGTGECYLFGTCNSDGGNIGCLSLACGGDTGGGTSVGDTTHPNDHITRADLQFAVDTAMDDAATKLDSAQCRTVFTKYTAPDGRTLQQVLDSYGVSSITYLTSWIQFNDGTHESRCSTGSTYPIYTTPGSRSIWACLQFVSVQHGTPGYAADLIIHEELHSLGLGEDPPSSADITRAVQDACGN
jgi:hypothetical protein